MTGTKSSCPCGSGLKYSDCCGVFHTGLTAAPTAEALMRSRYSAYASKNEAYLLRTWDARTRPAALNLAADTTRWLKLDILHTHLGGPPDTEGEVEFRAHYLAGSRRGSLHETSRFVRQQSAWIYLDGEIHPDGGETAVGRNDPCPCGSGRKFKHCCIS